MGKRLLEIACFSFAGTVAAQDAGADRLEYCENPAEGGTTPSYGNLKMAREKIHVPVFPIIRPRGGDFLYSNEEYAIMRNDIILCKNLGFDGVVIGLLNRDGSIDVKRTAQLVSLAYPMDVTFHRAFDRCRDPLQSMEQVIASGCTRILTSGQFPVAIEAASLISQLVNLAGERIIIMPASGINSSNILLLATATKAVEFHASARIPVPSGMQYTVETMKESLEWMGVNTLEIKKMLSALQTLD